MYVRITTHMLIITYMHILSYACNICSEGIQDNSYLLSNLHTKQFFHTTAALV